MKGNVQTTGFNVVAIRVEVRVDIQIVNPILFRKIELYLN